MANVDINELKTVILDVISDNEYKLEDLLKILDPISDYIDNQVFLTNFNDLVQVILEDRDGNNKFTFNDLVLLKNDILGITSIVNGILLILGTLPTFQLKYDKFATEELIFKILAYIFLVIVPKATNKPWNFDQKKNALDIIFSIYQVVLSSQIVKDLFNKIIKWFKQKGWCKCIHSESVEEHNQHVVEEHMPKIKVTIRSAIQKNKEINRLRREIHYLRSQVENN